MLRDDVWEAPGLGGPLVEVTTVSGRRGSCDVGHRPSSSDRISSHSMLLRNPKPYKGYYGVPLTPSTHTHAHVLHLHTHQHMCSHTPLLPQRLIGRGRILLFSASAYVSHCSSLHLCLRSWNIHVTFCLEPPRDLKDCRLEVYYHSSSLQLSSNFFSTGGSICVLSLDSVSERAGLILT